MLNTLIIDGHNYLFKGFYGVPISARRPDGTMINAVYGFFSLLRTILANLNPDYLVVVFDAETSIDLKLEINPEYKAQRAPVNENVYLQLPLIKACLDILHIKWFDDENNEADDLVGAYTSKFLGHGSLVHIGSNDFDFIQLVTESVFLLKTYHGKVTKFDESAVIDRFGIGASQYIDYLALKGDPSDNIKGIRGIGHKRASSLVFDHGDIPGIFRNFDKLQPGIQRLLLEKEAFLNSRKDFLKINTDTSLCPAESLDSYGFSRSIVPKKMGSFLTAMWDEIQTRIQLYG